MTIDTVDWLYAARYLKARHAGDLAAMERARMGWRWNIEEATVSGELWATALGDSCGRPRWATEVTERLPPQVLLLHGNRLNADHLG